MTYVPVVINVFMITNATTAEARFRGFGTGEGAKAGIGEWIASFKGSMGRKFFVESFAGGESAGAVARRR